VDEPVVPLQVQLTSAERIPGGLLFCRLRFVGAPAAVIDLPVHLTIYPTEQLKLLAAVESPGPRTLTLALARALGLPEDF